MARNVTLGEYYDNASGGNPAVGDYFETTPGGQLTGFGDYFETTPGGQMTGVGGSPDGLGRALGRVTDLSPLMRDWRRFRQARGMRGLGQDDPAQPTEVSSGASPAMIGTALVLGAIIRGAAGYAVGKAVAPNSESERSYALWGIPVGILFGTLGLGVEAAIALSKR